MKNKDSPLLQTPEMKTFTVTGIRDVYCTITRVGVLLLSLVQRPACLTVWFGLEPRLLNFAVTVAQLASLDM